MSKKTYCVSYKKKHKHTNTNKSRRKKGDLYEYEIVRTAFVSPSCHSEEIQRRAAQDLIREKNVALVGTKTYCVSTRKKNKSHTQKNKTSYSQDRIHQKLTGSAFKCENVLRSYKSNTKTHTHKSRLNKREPCGSEVVHTTFVSHLTI